MFVSYSRRDRPFVARLTGALEGRVESVWVDLKDLRSASVWSEELQLAVEQADALVFVISPDSVVSVQCATELEIAEALGKRIVPVCYRLVELGKLPDALARRQLLPPPELGVFEDDFDRWLGRLVDAVSTDIEWVRAHTEYEHRALEWDRHERDPSFLLTGSELRAAEAWRDNAAGKEPSLTKLQAAHITASRAHTTRRLRRTRAFVSGALVVAIGLAVTALVLRAQAVANQHTAQSRQLAASAEANLQTDPQLATLLALHALKTTYTTQAETALRDALPNMQLLHAVRHHGQVHHAAFSPDGKLIVTASQDGTCRIWSTATGKSTGVVLREPGGRGFQSAEFSPDGHLIVTTNDDGTDRVWNAQSGEPTGVTIHVQDPISFNTAVFSPDGRRIVTNDGRIIDSATGKVILSSPDLSGLDSEYSPDGRLIVTADDHGFAEISNAHTGSFLVELDERDLDQIDSAEFSPDGRWVVTASENGTAAVWDAHTGRMVGPPLADSERAPLEWAAFSPDERLIVTSAYDGAVRVWNAATRRQVALLAGHVGIVRTAEFSPTTPSLVVSAGIDGSARIWRATPSEQTLAVAEPRLKPIKGTVFSPDGSRFVTADASGRAVIWNAATGKVILSIVDPSGTSLVGGAAFSPDGRTIVTASSDGSARTFNAATGRPTGVTLIEPTRAPLFDVAFDSFGTRLVTASQDGTARIWSALGGAARCTISEPGGAAVRSASFSPNSRLVVTASADGVARTWSAAACKPTGVTIDEPGRGQLSTAAFSPDGHWIVTASRDGSARIWNASSGKHTRFVATEPTGASLNGAQFAPGGRMVLTAASDGIAQLWDSADGHLLVSYAANGSISAAFNPSGERVILGSGDGTATVWSTELAEPIPALLRVAGSRVTGSLTAAERRAFLMGN